MVRIAYSGVMPGLIFSRQYEKCFTNFERSICEISSKQLHNFGYYVPLLHVVIKIMIWEIIAHKMSNHSKAAALVPDTEHMIIYFMIAETNNK